MRLHRFYVSKPLGEEVDITDVSLLNQWTKVFRYRVDSTLILFNGDGYNYSYQIINIEKKKIILKQTKKEKSYISEKQITLFISIIKKDNVELVTQKATELGVTHIIPVISSRSEKKNISTDRLKKIVIESIEQSGRGDIPQIEKTISLEEAINKTKKEDLNIVFHTKNSKPIKEILNKNTKNISIFIGPEGGFTNDEIEMMDKKSFIVGSLGKTVLRAETAAIVSVGVCALS